MKRTAFVLAILTALSALTVSSASASPAIGESTTAVSNWLSYYIANLLRAHANGLVDLQVIDTGMDERLGGDADDYANGKDDKLGPDSDDKRDSSLTGSGGYYIGFGSRHESFTQ